MFLGNSKDSVFRKIGVHLGGRLGESPPGTLGQNPMIFDPTKKTDAVDPATLACNTTERKKEGSDGHRFG